VEREDNVFKKYAWSLWIGSDPEIIVTETSTSNDVESEWKQARQGSRELILQAKYMMRVQQLIVWKTTVDGVVRCTCKAVEVFEVPTISHSTGSETPGQSDASPRTLPKVAVELRDGTVHFMEIHTEEDLNLV
jgi:hypothetical protein